MEATRNLCAQIPISLHDRVREERESQGQSLSEYVTQMVWIPLLQSARLS